MKKTEKKNVTCCWSGNNQIIKLLIRCVRLSFKSIFWIFSFLWRGSKFEKIGFLPTWRDTLLFAKNYDSVSLCFGDEMQISDYDCWNKRRRLRLRVSSHFQMFWYECEFNELAECEANFNPFGLGKVSVWICIEIFVLLSSLLLLPCFCPKQTKISRRFLAQMF